MKLMISPLKSLAGLAVMMFLFGCASQVKQNALLEEARSVYAAAQSTPEVMKNAPLEMQRAKADLNRAEKLFATGEELAEVEHYAYLAKQRTAIAQEMTKLKLGEQAVDANSNERNRVLLEARTREAELAQKKAEEARMQVLGEQKAAEQSRLIAEEQRAAAELARQQAEEQKKAAEAALMAAEVKAAEAEKARLAAAAAEERARELEASIAELQAVKSERGLVITLGDVLFDTDKSELRSGAYFTINKLAAFLAEYPKRKAMIEGFTDSRGSEEYNQGLSERRAEAVRNALLAKGVAPDRLMIRGYGEAFPVATNETAAGRQLNRRVEVIVSDDEGKIMERTK